MARMDAGEQTITRRRFLQRAGVGALREIRIEPALRGRWKAWTGIGLAVVAPVLWVSAFLALAESGVF